MVSPGGIPPADAHPVPSSLSCQPPVPNTHISLRSTPLHLHVRDHGAAQGCHRRTQQVRDPWALPPAQESHSRSSLRPDPPDPQLLLGSCGHLDPNWVKPTAHLRTPCCPLPLLSLLLSPLLPPTVPFSSATITRFKILNQTSSVPNLPVPSLALRIKAVFVLCGTRHFSDAIFLLSTSHSLPPRPPHTSSNLPDSFWPQDLCIYSALHLGALP